MKIIIILICIQFVCSCSENVQNSVGEKVLTLPEKQTINGQTFFKNFELDAIVPIETTDDYLVNYIKRAIRWKDKLIFLT
ncbi:MAG: 6-bladed beta-propeller, partial [Prevotellaceae bacterium]|nr:6-bladed beta-propeller [Prevotellaceae bacterium]